MKSTYRTKAHNKRFDKLKELGCICCRKAGSGWAGPDIHHIFGKSRHDDTIPLCPYHHRGVQSDFGSYVGPSLADGKKPFEAYWGAQTALLDEVNELL